MTEKMWNNNKFLTVNLGWNSHNVADLMYCIVALQNTHSSSQFLTPPLRGCWIVAKVSTPQANICDHLLFWFFLMIACVAWHQSVFMKPNIVSGGRSWQRFEVSSWQPPTWHWISFMRVCWYKHVGKQIHQHRKGGRCIVRFTSSEWMVGSRNCFQTRRSSRRCLLLTLWILF